MMKHYTERHHYILDALMAQGYDVRTALNAIGKYLNHHKPGESTNTTIKIIHKIAKHKQAERKAK